MKFTILVILLSVSMPSLDLHWHSLPPIRTELNHSATQGGSGQLWKGKPEMGTARPGCSSPLTPAAELPLPGTCRRPGHCSPLLGQAACTCRKKTKTRFEIAMKITSVSTQVKIFLWEAEQEKIRLNLHLLLLGNTNISSSIPGHGQLRSFTIKNTFSGRWWHMLLERRGL